MLKRILVSPLEVAKGEDIVNLQTFLNSDLQRFFQAMLVSMGTGISSGVLTGFDVTVGGDGVSYSVAPGAALQSLSSPIAPSAFPFEIIEADEALSIPAQPPFSGFSLRYDVIEMRAKPATITNANRPFLQPSGGTSIQNTPKIANSLPELRLRSGVDGTTAFAAGWIPLALVTVEGIPTAPSYTVTDVRPRFRAPRPEGVSEISSPAVQSTAPSESGSQRFALSSRGVSFDGDMWFAGGDGVPFTDVLEGGVGTILAGTYLLHLWIAKPEGGARANLAQLILSATGPNRNGLPLNPLVMREPLYGLATVNARYLGAFPMIVTTLGSPPATTNVYTCPGLRKLGNVTMLPPDAVYQGTLATDGSSTGRYTLSLPYVPKTAGMVRVEFRVNLTLSGSLQRLGGYVKCAPSDEKLLSELELVNYFAINGSPPIPYGPPLVWDLPVNHNSNSSYATIELKGNDDYSLSYRILGWTESPDGSYVATG